MKNRIGMIVLILICVGLGIALIWSRNQADEQQRADAERIGNHSNTIVRINEQLDGHRQQGLALEDDLKQERQRIAEMTESNSQLASSLQQTESSLKRVREEVAQRDRKIAELESQNQVLDERALDLSTAITNLTVQIEETRGRLAASEGDKAFLERELQRLIAEKAELERKFNDLAVLRTQVARLREELSIARRIEWIRQGFFSRADQKGAEQLMTRPGAFSSAQAEKRPNYDLNVEVGADGSIRVIPPLTNRPAADPSAP